MDEIQRIPTVGIVILDGDKVLLVKHREKAGHITGIIGTPGGRIDAGETPLQSAVRELQEGTGIIVDSSDLMLLPHEYFGDLPRKHGSILHTFHRVFVGTKFSGSLQESDETTPFWMDISEAVSKDNSDFLINTQDMIQRAVKLLK